MRRGRRQAKILTATEQRLLSRAASIAESEGRSYARCTPEMQVRFRARAALAIATFPNSKDVPISRKPAS